MKVAANYLLVQNKAELKIRNIIYNSHIHFNNLNGNIRNEDCSKLFTLFTMLHFDLFRDIRK